MKVIDQTLVEKIGKKINKQPKYIKEQIAKRARRQGILSEAALFLWAKELKIPTSSYLRRLSSDIKNQIYNGTNRQGNNRSRETTSLRIIRIGKDENTIYNQLWFQILIIGVAVNVVSQIISAWLTNLLHLTNP